MQIETTSFEFLTLNGTEKLESRFPFFIAIIVSAASLIIEISSCLIKLLSPNSITPVKGLSERMIDESTNMEQREVGYITRQDDN